MLRCDDVGAVLPLPDGHRGLVLLVVTLASRGLRVPAVQGERLGEPVAAPRLLEPPPRRLWGARLREEKSDGLAVLRHRPLEGAPRPLHVAIGLVQAPADPHRALTALHGCRQRGT